MIGRTLSHYKVLEKIGEGGMGEVYHAQDTKLDRDVAIKVLPEAFSANKERLARFEREAKLLASLNHPNIAAIHQLEESDGVHFLALEYVSGETLAERIKRGPMPIDDTLPLFKQIAEGLEAAHEKGVVHRDLKPANIKITSEGKAKVLDFGLAKALAEEAPTQELSESPTLTRAATEAGVLLGTAPYMSPEQARGKPVDKRADIWAFGCCLYETLTGKVAFLGHTVSDTLVAVLEREPDWEALPQKTPTTIRGLLRRCLRKDANVRLHDMADARIEIEEAITELSLPGEESVRVSKAQKWRVALPWLVAVLIGGLAVWSFMRGSVVPSSPVQHFIVDVRPAEGLLGSNRNERMTNVGRHRPSRTAVALSPDGRHLVFNAHQGEKNQLYLRPLDQPEATPIPNTEGADNPFFSPDGQWIGFWADKTIKKIPLAGGPPVQICESEQPPFGASWGANDVIVFGKERTGLWSVPANGGTPEQLTSLAEGEWSHRLPHVLPGGRAIVFTILHDHSDWQSARVVAESLETGDRKDLIEGAAGARYVPTGHLVYMRLGNLMAAPFDPERLEITGGERGISENLMQAVNLNATFLDTGAAQYTFSMSGTLVYVTGGIFPDTEMYLEWIDRRGSVEPIPAPPGNYYPPRLSPDGTRVVFNTKGLNGCDIWTYDLTRGTLTRLTSEGHAGWPSWTPDGTHLVFNFGRGRAKNLFWMPADGSATPEKLTSSQSVQMPASWSPDGKSLVFVQWEPATDIWVLPMESGEPKTPQPLVQTRFQEHWPAISPDGRWLAYGSNETGRFEVYVQPFPGPGAKLQISAEGGVAPAWSKNGREIVYRGPGTTARKAGMVAVAVTAGEKFSIGTSQTLFELDSQQYLPSWPLRPYDISADGQRFLFLRKDLPPETPAPREMHVVVNWFQELERLVPTN